MLNIRPLRAVMQLPGKKELEYTEDASVRAEVVATPLAPFSQASRPDLKSDKGLMSISLLLNCVS